MPIYSDLSDIERMAMAELALNNAQDDPEMLAVLTDFGYPETRLDAGLALFLTAQIAHRAQDTERGEQFNATDALNTAEDLTRRAYMKHVKLARVAVEDDRGAQEDLGLHGKRKRDLEGWIDQARNFYTSALGTPSILAQLNPYNMSAAALTDAQSAVEQVEAARRAATEEKEDAETATARRRTALDALDAFMGAFIKVARVAFEDDPQRLERLGITVA